MHNHSMLLLVSANGRALWLVRIAVVYWTSEARLPRVTQHLFQHSLIWKKPFMGVRKGNGYRYIEPVQKRPFIGQEIVWCGVSANPRTHSGQVSANGAVCVRKTLVRTPPQKTSANLRQL